MILFSTSLIRTSLLNIRCLGSYCSSGKNPLGTRVQDRYKAQCLDRDAAAMISAQVHLKYLIASTCQWSEPRLCRKIKTNPSERQLGLSDENSGENSPKMPGRPISVDDRILLPLLTRWRKLFRREVEINVKVNNHQEYDKYFTPRWTPWVRLRNRESGLESARRNIEKNSVQLWNNILWGDEMEIDDGKRRVWRKEGGTAHDLKLADHLILWRDEMRDENMLWCWVSSVSQDSRR